MKFKTLILLSLLLGIKSIKAQQIEIKYPNPQVYDLMSTEANKQPRNFWIRKDSRMHFVIENLNKNLYTVSVNNTDKSWYGSTPAIFNFITNINVAKLDSALTGNKDKSAMGSGSIFDKGDVDEALRVLSNNYRDKREIVTGDISTYPAVYKKLKVYETHYRAMSDLLLDGCRDFKEIHADKLSKTISFLTSAQNVTGKSESEMSDLLKGGAEEQIKKLIDTYDKIYTNNEALKLIKPVYLEKLNVELVKKKASLNFKPKKREQERKDLKAVITAIETELQQVPEIGNIIEESLVAVKTVKTSVDNLNQADFPGTIKKTYDRINKGTWTFESSSFTAKKDAMEIKFSITAKDKLICENDHAAFNTEITGYISGFKINFSTGLFLLTGKNLFDRSYRTETIEGDSVNNKLLQNENKSKVTPAVGALMHFYHQSTHDVNVGGAFGLSINNDTNLAYHGGISLLIGKEQRLVFSGGATLARVQLIADEYQVGGKIPKTVTTVPTGNFYKWGGFFSFTYNISGL